MFTDPAYLAAWLIELRRQPLEQLLEGLHWLLQEELGAASLPPERRATLAEQVRNLLPAEVARAAKGYYADRPLPLAERERDMLQRVQALYAALERQYWLCVEGFEAQPESPLRRPNLAGALQRAIHALVSSMIEGYRARQVLDPGLWVTLSRLLDKAQASGVGREGVADEFNPNVASSVETTYGRAILLAAAQAGAMTPRNLDATLAMTALLEPFIDCTWQAAPAAGPSSSITRTGRLRVLRIGATTHLLNNTRLAGALQAMTQKLAANEPVTSLDVLPIERRELAGLLARLQRVWCGAGEIRAGERERTDERVAIASGAEAIYSLLTGTGFTMPHAFQVYAAGEVPGEGAARQVVAAGHSGTWQVLDRSEDGLRAKRSIEGARLTRGGLMGIRSDPSKHLVEYALGEIRWVQEDKGVALFAGVKLLPGRAQPIAARLLGGPAGQDYQVVAPAFVLEQGASPKLVLPHGWWKPERAIDVIRDGAMLRLRLGELAMRGIDFEICRFTTEKALARH